MIVGEYKYKGKKRYIVKTKYGYVDIYYLTYNKFKYTIESAVNKNEYFTNMANSVHSNRYSYSNVKYLGIDIKVLITCHLHGDFSQTPHNHLKGNNCTKCARIASSNNRITYNNGKGNAIVYCLELKEANGDIFYKIGFTKHSLSYRYDSFKGSKMPYDYNLLWQKVFTEKDAALIECKYHKILGKYHYVPRVHFAGCKTECFKIL